ncbi:C80 family cysteine peptidase, partial [Bathymodiolus thermophilus thioautotrophic gill symbiont]|uniref:C80 family cysteine peptidase n=1 Tax=Bathymodiolus thermophilus thioautotrophic gill symbiont TaxID=2360 RepID=UPI00192BC75B
IKVEAYNADTQTKPWLSINPGDSQITEDLGARHLGETQPYNDKKLQSWDTLTQEQTNKLTTESQKTKPDLANHDHQILFQTESDDNVKDSTLKLAFKHPTKTTIVQMDKDGAYRVVYGTQLKDITGKVKMVAVGYGREAEDGTQTLGGRSVNELSTNITTINQALNTDAATIKHVSLVGCNLASDNPTDDNTSTYGAEMLRQLKQTGVESISARSEYVAIDPDGKKLTSSTGTSEWRHKDSKAKTHYSFNEFTGEVESRVYNSEGTLVRYNGKHLNNDSQYQTNIIFQLENNDDTVKNATNALANKHPENSYIAKMDEAGNIKVYDVDGNEVALNVNGKYRINVVGHGSSMKTMGADVLSSRITALQAKL